MTKYLEKVERELRDAASAIKEKYPDVDLNVLVTELVEVMAAPKKHETAPVGPEIKDIHQDCGRPIAQVVVERRIKAITSIRFAYQSGAVTRWYAFRGYPKEANGIQKTLYCMLLGDNWKRAWTTKELKPVIEREFEHSGFCDFQALIHRIGLVITNERLKTGICRYGIAISGVEWIEKS